MSKKGQDGEKTDLIVLTLNKTKENLFDKAIKVMKKSPTTEHILPNPVLKVGHKERPKLLFTIILLSSLSFYQGKNEKKKKSPHYIGLSKNIINDGGSLHCASLHVKKAAKEM